jgi:hypothetical protein
MIPLILTIRMLSMPILLLQSSPPILGDAIIRKKAGESEIVITTTNRLAGAIDSLKWNGKEFIDSTDHGRQLQSAASFDCKAKGEFWAECYNPTEAGSRLDGVGPKSSSQLLGIKASGSELFTKSRMAFWLAPHEKSSGRPAKNTTILSDHLISKHVQIGYKKWDQVIQYQVTFAVPEKESHTYAQFEALTGYMPAEFSKFWKVKDKTNDLEELNEGPGEQDRPVVFSNPSGTHAMGIFSPDQPSKGYEKAGYGRFRFEREKVVKWNCVFRFRDPVAVKSGEYSFKLFVVVGNRNEVHKIINQLTKQSDAK